MTVHDGADACLDVRIRFAPTLPVVRLAGELDVSSIHLVRDSIESLAAAACSSATVLLDLSRVTFCDVAGLRAIEEATAVLTGTGKELVLYAVPRNVVRLIAVTGVAAHLARRGPTG